MALKHKKYVYVARSDGWYVKVRILKGRDENDPSRYIVVGPKVKEPPPTAQIIREERLPNEVRAKLYEI